MQPTARPNPNRPRGRRLAVPAACASLLISIALPLLAGASLGRPAAATGANAQPAVASAHGSSYEPGEVVVRYAASSTPRARAAAARAADAREAKPGPLEPRDASQGIGTAYRAQSPPIAPVRLQLLHGTGVPEALSRLRHARGVVWAVPDYIAHAAGDAGPNPGDPQARPGDPQARPGDPQARPGDLQAGAGDPEPNPNDPGTGKAPGDWRELQWNFAGPFGVDAPDAWYNVAHEGAPGGRGVVVAVLDTGVAYANRGRFRRSPDFTRYKFVRGYDFIARNHHPSDRNGHGTFVAGTIGEATHNQFGLTGLAWGAPIMPVRVLDGAGEGDASVIAEGVRFAVKHHARVINLSLEFASDVRAADIPELIEALRFAQRRQVVVVAAAGNEGSTTIPYPAHGPGVVAVGATTEHGCLASFSNYGRGIALVAPGGGPDAGLPGDPNCHPELPSGRDIFQMTFTGLSPRRFGFPSGYEGTSMATPHVAAAAALLIASGLLGPEPTPAQILARLKSTAQPLGGPKDRSFYGAGLLDVGAATAK